MRSELDLPTPNRELIRRLRRQWGHEKADTILHELLQAQLQDFWLTHSDGMYTRAEQMIIARGNRIARQLENSNSIVSKGMQWLWESWLIEMEARLRRPAW